MAVNSSLKKKLAAIGTVFFWFISLFIICMEYIRVLRDPAAVLNVALIETVVQLNLGLIIGLFGIKMIGGTTQAVTEKVVRAREG